jgi:hypothetical protein
MTRYPLSWPVGWKRTAPANRKRARFTKGDRKYHTRSDGSSYGYTVHRDLTVAEGVRRVRIELERMGVLEGDAIISTNLPVRLDGLPRSDAKRPDDPGAAVYWQREGEAPRCMAIDVYDDVADNLAAIAATLDALRAIERHGGAIVMERAFTGFEALPAPGARKDWRAVLELGPGLAVTLDAAQAAYRRLASKHHPDRGGNADKMAEINRAWEEAQAALS